MAIEKQPDVQVKIKFTLDTTSAEAAKKLQESAFKKAVKNEYHIIAAHKVKKG